MGMLMIADRTADCDQAINWPLFYMNDFSVLGLSVNGLSQALTALEADGFHIVRETSCAKVYFENHGRFKELFRSLKRNQIEYCTSDLAGCVYQG